MITEFEDQEGKTISAHMKQNGRSIKNYSLRSFL